MSNCLPKPRQKEAPDRPWQLECLEHFRKDFRRLRGEDVHPKVKLTLTAALALNGVPFGAKAYHFKLGPRYRFEGHRCQLRRVLYAVALTDPHLDYHKDLAALAATLLATNSEDSTYAVLVFLMEKFRFKQLLCDGEDHVALVIRSFHHFCPQAYHAVWRAGLLEEVRGIVGRWLRSFFASGFEPSELKSFERLLDALLTIKVRHSADPFAELRQICVHLLLRNAARLLTASRENTLNTLELGRMESIRVSEDLFHLMKQLNSETSQWSIEDVAAFLPVTLALSWGCMLELDLLLPGSSMLIPAAGACTGMVAGYLDGFKWFTRFRPPPPKAWGKFKPFFGDETGINIQTYVEVF